jgi:hypothetical protein
MLYSRHYGKKRKELLELQAKQREIIAEASKAKKEAKSQIEKHKIHDEAVAKVEALNEEKNKPSEEVKAEPKKASKKKSSKKKVSKKSSESEE